MKRTIISLLILLATAPTWAQSDPEYRMEMGAGIGMMGYLGDFNGSLTKDLQPMGTLLARYNLSPYMGVRMNVSFGKMKGTSADVKTYYPKFASAPYTFSNSLVDVGLAYEYNFLPYGTGRDYRGAKRLSPYAAIGLGATYVKIENGDRKSAFTANLPIGIGLKYKIGERTNIGLEWAMHFSLSDELDGQKDPYGIQSSGLFKNTDCYSTLQLTFTYSFMAKCRTCHNEDE
ncbi:MAG: porin family protein [Prevotella sp.]|nr:porin family protein [Prevotella sp.]